MSKHRQEIVEMLEQSVDVRRLVRKLFFRADNLETASLSQPSLYIEAGRFQAQSAGKVSTAKRRLLRISGEESIKIRHKHDVTTEGAVKARLSLNHEIRNAQKEVDQSEVIYEFAKQLTEAYKERLLVLNILAKLKASEISSELRSVRGQAATDVMRKQAKRARRLMEEAEEQDD